jgi:hypothetical protein
MPDLSIGHEIKNYDAIIAIDCCGQSSRAQIVLRGDAENKPIGSIIFWDHDENIPNDSVGQNNEITMNLNISMLHDVIDLLRHSVHIDFFIYPQSNRARLRDGYIQPIGAYMKPPVSP